MSARTVKIGDGQGAIPERVVASIAACDSLSPQEKFVAVSLLAYTGLNNPKFQVGQPRVGAVTGVDQGTVSRTLSKMQSAGLIVQIKKASGRRPAVFRFADWPGEDEAGWGEAKQSAPAPAPAQPPPTSINPDDLDRFLQDESKRYEASKRESAPADPKLDPIRAVLKRGGVMGANLNKLASDPEMTVALARKLIEQSKQGDNPGAVAWSLWKGGWRGEEAISSEPNDGTRGMTKAEMHEFYSPQHGMTAENYAAYIEEASPLLDAWESNPGDETKEQYMQRVIAPIRKHYQELSHG